MIAVAVQPADRVGWHIRHTHPDGFRSGEWATIVATGISVAFPGGREIYVVQFNDNVFDLWVVDDPSDPYEFEAPADEETEPITRYSRCRSALEERGMDPDAAANFHGMCAPLAAPRRSPDERFLLVEKNLKSEPPYWFSLHPSPDCAAAYHHGQEFAEDWEIEELIDLDTGESFVAETSSVFVKAEPDS